MLIRILCFVLTFTFAIACDDESTSGTEEAGSETAGSEEAGSETAGSEEGGSETAGAEVTNIDYASFMAEGLAYFAEQTCQSYFTCFNEGRLDGSNLEIFFSRHATVESCIADFSSFLPTPMQENALEAGLITFNAELAQECVNEIRSLMPNSCDDYINNSQITPESCELAIQGTVEAGGDCSDNDQCVAGYCEVSGEMICEIGTCVSDEDESNEGGGTGMIGDSCEASEDCVSNLRCNLTDMVCAEPSWHMEGETCELGGAKLCSPGLVCNLSFTDFSQSCTQPIAMGGECIFGPQCEIGLTCIGLNFETGMPGSCEAFGDVGASCVSENECAPGLLCDQGVCSDSVQECALPMSSME